MVVGDNFFMFVYFFIVGLVAATLGYLTYAYVKGKEEIKKTKTHQALEFEHSLTKERPVWKEIISNVHGRIGRDMPEIPEIQTSSITQLQEFISKMREEGYTDHKIHARLNRRGWPQDVINKYLKE